MTNVLRAKCPACKKTNTVSNLDGSETVAQITCEACGKRFGVRIPESARLEGPPPQSARSVAAEDPFAGIHTDLPSGPILTGGYGVRRKPLVSTQALTIAVSVAVGIFAIVGVGMLLTKTASEIDLTAVGDSLQNGPADTIGALLKGPADTIDKIHAEWLRYENEQAKMIKGIARKSDCTSLLLPLERLQENQLGLLVRAALLEPVTDSQVDAKSLPAFPPANEPEGKSFSTVEAYLTNEFRERRTKLDQLSDAVLSCLHTALEKPPAPSTPTEKAGIEKILIKRVACRALAEAHRGEVTSKTAVAIYELAEDLKKARGATPEGAKTVTTLPTELQKADLTADRMLDALAARFTADEKSEIAKALAALKQSF